MQPLFLGAELLVQRSCDNQDEPEIIDTWLLNNKPAVARLDSSMLQLQLRLRNTCLMQVREHPCRSILVQGSYATG